MTGEQGNGTIAYYPCQICWLRCVTQPQKYLAVEDMDNLVATSMASFLDYEHSPTPPNLGPPGVFHEDEISYLVMRQEMVFYHGGPAHRGASLNSREVRQWPFAAAFSTIDLNRNAMPILKAGDKLLYKAENDDPDADNVVFCGGDSNFWRKCKPRKPASACWW